MSRDWTPRELFYADKEYGFRDRKIEMVYKDEDGNEKTMAIGPTDKEKELYPNLSFLGEGAMRAMQSLGMTEEEIMVFEKELSAIVENEDINIPASNWDRPDIDSTLRLTAQWFEGVLDPSFYYRERNDEAFAEQAMELVREKGKECGV